MLHRVDSRLAPSQWEILLQSNAVSHWLGANLESALLQHYGNNEAMKFDYLHTIKIQTYNTENIYFANTHILKHKSMDILALTDSWHSIYHFLFWKPSLKLLS